MASQIKVFATYITASHWYPECANCNNKATPYEIDNEYEVTVHKRNGTGQETLYGPQFYWSSENAQ